MAGSSKSLRIFEIYFKKSTIMLRHGTGAFELLIVRIVFQGSVNMLGVVHSITVTIVQVLE